MRIITWNINSVRARLDIVSQLIKEYDPDVLCLQETKVQDHMFPEGFFAELGMPHLAIHGQKSHHGVATAAKQPLMIALKLTGAKKAMRVISQLSSLQVKPSIIFMCQQAAMNLTRRSMINLLINCNLWTK